MARALNLVRRGTSYHFRMAVPPDLRPVLGCREVKRTLSTACQRTARSLALLATHRTQHFFEVIRSMSENLDTETLKYMVREYFEGLLMLDAQRREAPERQPKMRINGRDVYAPKWERDQRAEELAWIRREFEEGDLRRVEGRVQEYIERYGLGIPVDASEDGLPDPRYAELCVEFMRALVQATEVMVDRDGGRTAKPTLSGALEGDWPRRPPIELATASPVFGASQHPSAKPPIPEANLTPTRLLDVLFGEKPSMREESREKYRVAIALLDEVTGGKAVWKLTRQDVNAYIKLVQELPKNGSKTYRAAGDDKPRKRTGRELIKAAREDEEERRAKAQLRAILGEAVPREELNYTYPRISGKTASEGYLAFVKAFITWAWKKGYVAEDVGRKLTISKRETVPDQPRLPFTTDELQRIFNLPLFTSCHSDHHCTKPGDLKLRNWKFWAPLLALYTGMRANEIGQLARADLSQSAGQWYLKVTDSPDADAPGRKRRVKTANSRRLVPIHPELIRIGFLDYARTVRSGRLFPDWKPDAKGFYSGTLSKWFNRTLCKAANINDPSKVFHSFRHNFNDLLGSASLNDKYLRAIMGHAQDQNGRYGTKELPPEARQQFNAMRYEELDLSHISC